MRTRFPSPTSCSTRCSPRNLQRALQKDSVVQTLEWRLEGPACFK